MLPAFWVLGLESIAFGVPLWLGRVKANPYYGLTIGESGERDDVWYPVNSAFGRDLVFLGGRILLVMSFFATVDWREPYHYLIVTGSVLVAEAMLFWARWRVISRALLKLEAEKTPEGT